MGWRDVPTHGPAPHPQWHEHPGPGETDFLGRPYPPASMDDRPWGLIEQDRRQARALGYDRGYAAGYRRGRYEVEYDVRPEDYHPRFIPDSDEAGMDVHRYGRGPRMRYTSDWTRWF
jgi:hypothetical protein